MRKLNLLILVLISSFTAMRAVTSEKDLWQLHTSDIHADYVGAPVANGNMLFSIMYLIQTVLKA